MIAMSLIAGRIWSWLPVTGSWGRGEKLPHVLTEAWFFSVSDTIDLTHLDTGQSFSECRTLNSGCQDGWWSVPCDQVEANLPAGGQWVQVPDKGLYMTSQEHLLLLAFHSWSYSFTETNTFQVLERPRYICGNHMCFLCVTKVTEINSGLPWWMNQAGLMEQSVLPMASKTTQVGF